MEMRYYQYQMNKRLDGPQSWLGCGSNKEISAAKINLTLSSSILYSGCSTEWVTCITQHHKPHLQPRLWSLMPSEGSRTPKIRKWTWQLKCSVWLVLVLLDFQSLWGVEKMSEIHYYTEKQIFKEYTQKISRRLLQEIFVQRKAVLFFLSLSPYGQWNIITGHKDRVVFNM